MPYTKKNGDGTRAIDWGKITETLIGGILLVLVLGTFNWFLVVRDLKRDMTDLKTDFKRGIGQVFTQNKMIGRTIWNHIHPNEPCPWPEIDPGSEDENTKKK
jgi:hypothetical protein